MGSLGNDLPLWTPNPKNFSSLHLEKFRKLINEKYNTSLECYLDLHEWSVKNRSSFWAEVWDYTGVICSETYSSVIDESLSIETIPKWFQGAKLNFAENLLEKGQDDAIALYFKGEGHGKVESWTFGRLRKEVALWVNALKKSSIGKGDVVAGILPNCPQTLAALLAVSAIGGIWTCTSPDYGTTGVVERFKQTEPKLIISVNAVFYNGKTHCLKSKLESVVNEIPTVEKVVIIPFVENAPWNFCSQKEDPLWVSSEEFLKILSMKNFGLDYEQVPFDHPLFIMYSSGTTGPPKCIVHSVGGTLIKHLEEHILQSNLNSSDVIFYYTTVGWMMYNWLISSLAAGAALVLYDGSPSTHLWSMIEEFDITIFGTSAKWLAVQEDLALKKLSIDGESEAQRAFLDKSKTKLRMVLSTGSPLKPQSFDFVYNFVKKDVLLGSISGGTDIIGCFMGQNPTLPVYRGEIQSFHLGCDLDCFDEDGKSILGERGELIVKQAFPSMPTHFHKDSENVLYRKAYFAKFQKIWAHGDFIIVNPKTKGIVMLGRSDATLNPNGVRFGSAEIYQIVEKFIEVADSVCVSQRNLNKTEERVVLFLKLAQGISVNQEELILRIKKAIREHLSPRHVPAVIETIPDIPYTISGKKVEIAVRNVIESEEVKNLGALANPECLSFYKNLKSLQVYS